MCKYFFPSSSPSNIKQLQRPSSHLPSPSNLPRQTPPPHSNTKTMAEPYHCIYCIDTLVAHFENRKPLPLATIQQVSTLLQLEADHDATLAPTGHVLAINGIPPPEPTKIPLPPPPKKLPDSPLFVTWNKEASAHKLRGCIGTFEPQPLEDGLSQYALTA